MKKTSPDGTTKNYAMYARNAWGQIRLISTDGYDIDNPTDEQVEYAEDELGGEVFFFEEEC